MHYTIQQIFWNHPCAFSFLGMQHTSTRFQYMNEQSSYLIVIPYSILLSSSQTRLPFSRPHCQRHVDHNIIFAQTNVSKICKNAVSDHMTPFRPFVCPMECHAVHTKKNGLSSSSFSSFISSIIET